MIKNKGIDWTGKEAPDYCEQPLLLNAEDSYIAKFDEYTQDRESYVAWFTPTSGDGMEGEMSDTCYVQGDIIPYHEHNRGHEVFLVESGNVEVVTRGYRTIANAGDLVFIPPCTSHSFKYLDEPTVWREWFQGIKMNEGLLEQRRFREYGDASMSAAHFDQKIARRLATDWFDFEPVACDVPKEDVKNIRPYDFSYKTFEFPGIKMLEKISRYEMGGNIEFWQYRMDKGFTTEVNMWNAHGVRWSVFAGSVEVRIPGLDPFTAKVHDIINIPAYMPCELVAAEDGTVLYDYSCKGYLYRALEFICAKQEKDPVFLEDKERLVQILEEKYDIFTIGSLKE